MKLDVTTPERVAVELPLAGVGSRAAAYLIDAAVLLFAAFLTYFIYSLIEADPLNAALRLSTWARVGALVAIFFVLFIYWTLSEVVLGGQTIGKRLLRIRVVRMDGSPITTFDAAVRNLLRLIDFMPLLYAVGTLAMLVDKKHRRIGDLAAGTVLIREERIDLAKYAQAEAAASHQLSATEVDVIASFLERAASLDPQARLTLGRQLAQRVGVSAAEVATMNEELLMAALRARLGKPAHG